MAEGPLLRVELDVGFPLKALLTRQAAEELEVREGGILVAWLKVSQVHLIPREP